MCKKKKKLESIVYLFYVYVKEVCKLSVLGSKLFVYGNFFNSVGVGVII